MLHVTCYMKIVIMAGGGGTRLWPLSRENRPKQFCKILGDKTMFEQTVERFRNDFEVEDIYVCLNSGLLDQARALAPEIPLGNYIIEPEKRDTAPAMGLVAAKLFKSFPDEPVAYIPSDHYIGDVKRFVAMIKKADAMIRETGKMLDIAVTPTFPSTALGYTRVGKKMSGEESIEVYEFLGHAEKPEFETAKKYLEQGDYLWHASYYMWTPRKILEAFDKYSPEHGTRLREISKAGDEETTRKNFSAMPQISFDYVVTEKIDPANILIIKGDFGWSDVGTFDILYDAQKAKVDEAGNLSFSNFIGREASGCLIYGRPEKMITVVGVEDLVIVDTDDALLVCPKSKAHEIKKVVQSLKENKKESYL